MKENETIPPEVKTRRKLLAGIGLLSFFPLFKSGLFTKKNPVISCAPPPIKKANHEGFIPGWATGRSGCIKNKPNTG